VQHADRILVLEQGRVAESGTHLELMERGGIYRRLYDLQFAG
jgi:ABC-type multidrug transport system fused ATPase/permease subunit